MSKYRVLNEMAKLFMVADASHEEIEISGNQAIATIYGCKHGSDLNFERASKFTEKVASISGYLPLNVFHRHQMLPDSTASGSTSKCRLG